MGTNKRTGRFAVSMVAAGALCALAGCATPPDAGGDRFVGRWACGGDTVTLSANAITTGARTERIAWIETGKNADYGLFTTKGARYSVFDATGTTMTLHAHEGGTTRQCRRLGA